jgi:hypothetical protein
LIKPPEAKYRTAQSKRAFPTGRNHIPKSITERRQPMTNVFSKEIPALLQEHLDHLKGSALSLEVIKERGYRSELNKAKLKEVGFSTAQQRIPGILIPLHGVTGEIIGYQYRPDNPRRDSKRERLIKYENPTGSSVRLDVPPRCRQQLGNPAVPVWFTEGVKKVDALATLGACAVGLTGVWAFKGKNKFGGTTLLADFDHIALKGRTAYLIFDSDSLTNPHVTQALNRLAEHLKRKEAAVRILRLPPGAGGEKVGVDDYIAAGHGLPDLVKLESFEEAPRPSLRERSADVYRQENSRVLWMKQTRDGEAPVLLCNFVARVIEDILKDNGHETSRVFKIEGKLASGHPLPTIEVPASQFAALNWVLGEWGLRATIAAGQTYKDRLREAIQLMSEGAVQKVIYTHTGWREISGRRTFLTAGGALDMPDVDVELEGPLRRYCLPAPPPDPSEAIKASLEFLELGSPALGGPAVTLTLWAVMYLAPLSELLNPSFTVWIVGPSGSFKSTLAALALSHFGEFDVRTLPASWRDTANYLEKQMALAKDIPLVVDDWAPAQDMSRAREYEAKAEQVARAQGNRMGRGRLRSDTSSRAKYVPRGMLISTGEQLPSGQSHTARLFSVELETGAIDTAKLTAAQQQASLYAQAMAGYIAWLRDSWGDIAAALPGKWEEWRDQARGEATHPRLPEAVAWLYTGLNLALAYAEEKGAIDAEKAAELRRTGMKTFVELASSQGGRVEDERPGRRFIEGLRSLVAQGKVVFGHKDELEPRKTAPNETVVGWMGEEDRILLNPTVAFSAVHDLYQRAGEPFTFKQTATWKDLKRLGYIECPNGRTSDLSRIHGQPTRVIKLKSTVLGWGRSDDA